VMLSIAADRFYVNYQNNTSHELKRLSNFFCFTFGIGLVLGKLLGISR
jgi:hypothetical protein